MATKRDGTTKQVETNISTDLLARLDEWVLYHDRSRSWAIRKAIENWCQLQEEEAYSDRYRG